MLVSQNSSSKELGFEKGICWIWKSPKLDHIRWEIWEGFKTADTDNEQRPDGGWRVNCLKAWSRISRVWEDITRIAKVSLFKNIHTGKASIIEEMLCQELPLAASRHCSVCVLWLFGSVDLNALEMEKETGCSHNSEAQYLCPLRSKKINKKQKIFGPSEEAFLASVRRDLGQKEEKRRGEGGQN